MGVAKASRRGIESEVAHMWADWLQHPCRIAGPQCSMVGDEIKSDPHVGGPATSPMPHGGGQRFKDGERIRSGPHVGGLATSPFPSRGSTTLPSGEQNQ